ncbi:thyroglobulin type-1 repeat domain-containing protein [Phthorimaea operculella]|nr:thyroglobulin type-1 repeat domain-containing protein [Phthorimaea operculella]
MFVLRIFILVFGVSYANECELAQMCVTDLTCPAGQTLVPNTAVNGCCPSCQTPSTGGVVIQQDGCQAPSNCLPNGKYAPVQCKGDMFIGRCFCTDEDGNRIFGQMWRSEASQMTCACSRRRYELEKAGRNDVTLHCTANGDYEVLQCDDGLCWCAEPKTGQPTVIPLPEEDMKHLPCCKYDVTTLLNGDYSTTVRRRTVLVRGAQDRAAHSHTIARGGYETLALL